MAPLGAERVKGEMNAMRVLGLIALLWAVSVPCLAQPPGLPPLPPNAANMTPAQAKALYDSLDPATRQALKDAAAPYKAQVENDPGLKARLKAWIKSWLGR